MAEQFIVRGTITDREQRRVAGVVVRAYDRDLPSLKNDELLGEAITDAEGVYAIEFGEERFRARERARADLYIEVFGDGADALLGRSSSLFNPEREARIDLTIDHRVDGRRSEYEMLVALLTPLVEPLSFAELTAEDIEFLVNDTRADRRHVAWLSASARLSRQTNVPPEAFYGWARHDPPLPRDWIRVPDTREPDALRELLDKLLVQLVATPADQLRDALLAAIHGNIIPAFIRDLIDEILRALLRSQLVSRRAVGRLLNDETGAPLASTIVRIIDLEATGGEQEIDRQTTSADGLFTIAYGTAAGAPEPAARRLRLEVPDSTRAGAAIWSTDVRIATDQQDVLEFRVALPRAPEPDTHGIDQVVEAAQIDVPPELQQFLQGQGIRGLGDIRRVGGLAHVDGLPVDADTPAIRALDAHADLSRISGDVTANRALIDKGFTSLAGIASTPLPDFVTAMHETIGDFNAGRLNVVARAQTTFLKNVLTGLAIDRANGFAPLAEDRADPKPIRDPLPEQCGCDDCEAAVSPAAYLADLIGYAATHLKENGNLVTLGYLEKTFHQPFGELPTDCEAVHEYVRQVRICIEVLRAYIAAHPLSAAAAAQLEAATRTYLLSTYAMLLARFGTSYEEIRLARVATRDERLALASRLGIDLTEPRPDPLTTPGDELDQLFLDADAIPPDPHAFTEQALERLFGLVDTTRDPLSDGVKLGDSVATPELAQWRVAGGIWAHNTDDEGVIHLQVKNFVTSHLVSEVQIFRDSARTELIAAGQGKVLSGNRRVKVVAKNASGLSGTVTVSGTSADNTDISIALVPKLLVWRLRNLRTVWRQQDFRVDVYSEDFIPASDRQPIVDPDVIGPDDFRDPDPTKAPFGLWRTRRLWVDLQLQDLAGITKALVINGQTVTVPDIDKVLARMYAPVTYAATTLTPWQTATPVTQFAAINDTLEHGSTADVAAATARIATDLALAVDAFVQIVRVRAKQLQWETDPKSDAVLAEEWRDLFSILVRSSKQRFFPAWIAEEKTAPLRFGPADFWPSLREPREGDWPPIVETGHPLIDPDEVKLTDLPEPTVGKAAIQMWNTRRAALEAETAAIRNERETNGFDAMLRLALGHPGSGNPLQHDLDTIKTDLASSNAATVTAATDKIVKDLHLTLESFNKLMTMKEQAAPASTHKPTPAEWAELYALLTTVHKVKHLYAVWVAQETAAGFTAEYWRAVKARLPRVRATAEQRAAWRHALTVRSRPPIIDPDLVEVGYFNGLGAEPAFTLWQTRKTWVATTIAAMPAAPATTAVFDTMVEDAVSMPMADLLAIDEARAKGEAIQARLDQLSLTNAAFVYLLKLRAIVAAAQPVTPAEWENVHSILAQVMKRRLAAEWRDEERLAGVSLSPDFFVPPDALPLPVTPVGMRWRVSQEDRFDWLDTLQSRVDQERSLLASFHEVVSGVEEASLPSVRDALIEAAGAGAEFAAKAAWVTDRLVIDAKAGGCQKTTRIAQAIETLQGLFFVVRTGQSKTLQTLVLTLVAPDFDEEWRWMGSYATWRAAMFVWMYPENIASGALRRRQTPAFRALLKAIRATRRMTNDQACALAAEYATYYEDVARLAIGGSAQANVTERSGSKCVPGVISKKPLVFLFGRGGVSNRLYWSTFNPADTSGYAQGFWDFVPGAPEINGVPGVALYERTTTDRRLFVFITTKEHKLQFLTFDLESRVWTGPTDLALPSGDAKSLDITVDQNDYNTYQPRLVIRSGSDFFHRPLNPDGTGWEEGDWKKFQLDNKDLNLNGVTKLYAYVEGVMWVREGGEIEQRYTNTYWSNTTSSNWKDAEYIGAVYWGKAKNAWNRWLVIKRTDGVFEGVCSTTGAHPISDQFGLPGLKTIAPNSGSVNHASFAYERRNLGKPGETEQDGVYLRLVELEATLSSNPLKSQTWRVAPPVVPGLAGQFSIPARLEGAAADARRNVVKLMLAASAGVGTNRTFVEEACYFVPMALSDGLRRSGEFVSALDWARTVFDYASPAGKQKIYYGLVEEETLSNVYKRAPDWLRDPLDPHAIATTRRLTYTRFTLLTIARILLECANDDYTRDTVETVPRARVLYLTALTVLDLPELKQQLGRCDDIIGEIEIPLGPEAPAKAGIGIGEIKGALKNIKDVVTLKSLVADVNAALAVEGDWDDRLASARKLVEDAMAAEPPKPTMARALEIGAAMETRALATVRTSPLVEHAAEEAGRAAGARFLTTVASAAAVAPSVLEAGNITLPWLRKSAMTAPVREVDFVFKPDLTPVAPAGSSSIVGMLRPGIDEAVGLFGREPFVPEPLPPPNPVPPVVAPSLAFCIPPNPMLAALRLQAELNLHKLRTCRNIAGMKRELEPYAAPTDTVTGLPTIGASGQLVLPGTSVIRPTLYRFAVLMQRAKELVAMAQQIEASMLAAIEKRDAEAYSMLRARQDLELAQAGVQLETLRLKQANDGVTLANLQQARAQIQLDHYQKLLDEDLLELERGAIETLGEALSFQGTAADLNFAAAIVYGAAAIAGAVAGAAAGSVGGPLGTVGGAIVGGIAGGAGSVANGLTALSSGYSSLAAKRQTSAQIQLQLASFERRRQDWELSASLAKQDVAIGGQQVTLAVDAVDIVKQEKIIAETRNTHAKDTVAFLANKFTNVELYDWMSDVLEGVYSFFLQQATSTARLAENQLAFERQEPPAAFIQSDYWQAPDDSLPSDNVDAPVLDRRGLTGSARLLQDLYRLDQYSFETNKRKLQLSKTISLALTAPTEFQRFRENGVMTFATPMILFDRDFPGHLLRLIRGVRTSVIALVSPVQGIHATLSSVGLSRVVIGPDIFQTVPIRRDPELVALTSPMNASGVFELEAHSSGMLLPFEGTGVDTTWELRMPKAANFFDYRTIADVLITMDYTAVHSWDYAQQVIPSLRQSTDGDRPFSFRNQLPDQWYDLHNPEQTASPMVVRFRTVREDFPPNLDALKIQHVVLHFARKHGAAFEVPVSGLRFVEEGSPGATGGSATSIDGIISTRRGNAGSWMSFLGKRPIGEWELALPNTEEMRNRFAAQDIEDVLFIITYSARTHEWPA